MPSEPSDGVTYRSDEVDQLWLGGEVRDGDVTGPQRDPPVGGQAVVGDAAVPVAGVGRRDAQRPDRTAAQHRRRVDRLAGAHPGEAPPGAGAQIARALGQDHQVGVQGQPGRQQSGVDRHGLQVAAEGLADGDRPGQQPGLAQRGHRTREGQRQRALVGHHIDHPGSGAVVRHGQSRRGEGGVQVGNHHRHAVEGVRVAEELVVRRTLLVGPGDHGLQRQVAGLDQVPGRLRRLCGHPAGRIQHGDHQRVAAGAQTPVQGPDIEQHPVADGWGRHQVGVGQGPDRL